MTDAEGEVTLTQSYTPYGEVLESQGTTTTAYAFTGEDCDALTGLVYMRARYYQPGDGRFVSKDTWAGNPSDPLSLNNWIYVKNNVLNQTDPSGYSPLLCDIPFIGCADTAKNTVIAAKALYSQAGPLLLSLSQKNPWNNRFNCLDPRWTKPESAIDLVADYLCERGPDTVLFNRNDALTNELARSILLDAVRKEFYKFGDITTPKESKFNPPEFILALIDGINFSTGEFFFPITHFLGSFDYRVEKSSTDRVEFEIINRTDLASGTHIPTRFPPFEERNNPYTLEQFVQEHKDMENEGVIDILLRYPEIVAILEPRTRGETGFLMGGGNMYQTFRWSEHSLGCLQQKIPWPFYLQLIDIQ